MEILIVKARFFKKEGFDENILKKHLQVDLNKFGFELDEMKIELDESNIGKAHEIFGKTSYTIHYKVNGVSIDYRYIYGGLFKIRDELMTFELNGIDTNQ